MADRKSPTAIRFAGLKLVAFGHLAKLCVFASVWRVAVRRDSVNCYEFYE